MSINLLKIQEKHKENLTKYPNNNLRLNNLRHKKTI